jgi:hypothetical protein
MVVFGGKRFYRSWSEGIRAWSRIGDIRGLPSDGLEISSRYFDLSGISTITGKSSTLYYVRLWSLFQLLTQESPPSQSVRSNSSRLVSSLGNT